MPNSDYPPLSDAGWPASLDGLKGGFATRLNVYRVMAHRPALLNAWAPLRDHLVVQTALGAELSEVAILRTGHRLGSPYEWAHHVVRSRKIGMSDARIGSIRGPVEEMAEADAVIAGAVDALFDDHRIGEELVAQVEALVGSDGLFDLIATVGFYSVLGGILNTTGTPIDADVAAALEADPFEG
ncbi:carboxymuconolactone decarboxylase family protein [Puniceibacterium sediminis]|uniref:Carboxymuconolactone decarboxylase family protein n=1 Tax=Puniceibacterium sediminis TaxID=1608407 RepID=A0A238VI68_9RHOB|nr:carboxymuconolactone decarboxylase family protein [Puniceibacterium sediminis]SNR33189.1 Carboxymuconolactone decarboxylase family protein [Puniceibacterium sediminis]